MDDHLRDFFLKFEQDPGLGLDDPLNLKALIGFLAEAIRSICPTSKAKNALGVIRLLLQDVASADLSAYADLLPKQSADGHADETRIRQRSSKYSYTPPSVADLQKLLSGNLALSSLETFCSLVQNGAYDEVFRRNLEPVVSMLRAENAMDALRDKLMTHVYRPSFSLEEIEKLCQLEDLSFLLELFRHGFATVENIPDYFGQRMYAQAMTFSHNNPVRFSLLKEAADNGNEQAAFEYANFLIYRSDYNLPLEDREKPAFQEALHYFLKARRYSPALWNIGFILQRYDVSPETVQEVKDCLGKLSVLDQDLLQSELHIVKPAPAVPNPEAQMLAYRIHFYLAYRMNFTKALNSLGLFLYTNKVVVDSDKTAETRESLILKYWGQAAQKHDLYAMTNLGSQWMRQLLFPESNPLQVPYDFLTNLRMMKIAAKAKMPEALYNLALIDHQLFMGPLPACGEPEDMLAYANTLKKEHVRAQLERALKREMDADHKNVRHIGELNYRLGQMEELDKEKIAFYNKAMDYGHADATFELMRRKYFEGNADSSVLSMIEERLEPIVDKVKRKEDAANLLREVRQKRGL